jgi:hypothetical protein
MMRSIHPEYMLGKKGTIHQKNIFSVFLAYAKASIFSIIPYQESEEENVAREHKLNKAHKDYKDLYAKNIVYKKIFEIIIYDYSSAVRRKSSDIQQVFGVIGEALLGGKFYKFNKEFFEDLMAVAVDFCPAEMIQNSFSGYVFVAENDYDFYFSVKKYPDRGVQIEFAHCPHLVSIDGRGVVSLANTLWSSDFAALLWLEKVLMLH